MCLLTDRNQLIIYLLSIYCVPCTVQRTKEIQIKNGSFVSVHWHSTGENKLKKKKIVQCNERNGKRCDLGYCIHWSTSKIDIQAYKNKKQTCSGNTHLELIPPKHLQHINILHVREDKKCHTYLEFYLIDIWVIFPPCSLLVELSLILQCILCFTLVIKCAKLCYKNIFVPWENKIYTWDLEALF